MKSEEDELANSVAFSPDGTILAETGDDAKIRLWDVQTQRQNLRVKYKGRWCEFHRFSSGRENIGISERSA